MHANAASAGILPQETEGTGERTVAVVVNPTKIGDMGDLKAVVEQAAADAGYSATRWYGTTPDDPGAGQTRAALAEGPAVVIAAGGDGSPGSSPEPTFPWAFFRSEREICWLATSTCRSAPRSATSPWWP